MTATAQNKVRCNPSNNFKKTIFHQLFQLFQFDKNTTSSCNSGVKVSFKKFLRISAVFALSAAGGCSKTESGLTGVGLGSAVGAGIGYAIDGGAGGALAGAALGGIAGGAVGVATNKDDDEPQTSKKRKTAQEVSSLHRSEDELERARSEVKRKRLERETLEIENEKKRLQLEKKRLELEEAKLDQMKRKALQDEERYDQATQVRARSR